MRAILLSAGLFALSLCVVRAEEAVDHAMGATHAAAVPPACEAAARPGTASAGGAGMDHAMPAMGEGAMAPMDDAMRRAATIPDPDLAFNCAMIAHHRGALAMAEIELKAGRDEASIAMARRIIAAQEAEIAEMTARIEALAK